MRYIVIAQVLLAGTTAALFLIQGIGESLAGLYGGGIAVGNGLTCWNDPRSSSRCC